MNEFSITVNIKCPELAAAVNHLANVLAGSKAAVSTVPETVKEDTGIHAAVVSEKSDTSYHIEDIRSAFMDYARAKGKDRAKSLLNKYGVSKVTELSESDYPAVMKDLRGGDD